MVMAMPDGFGSRPKIFLRAPWFIAPSSSWATWRIRGFMDLRSLFASNKRLLSADECWLVFGVGGGWCFVLEKHNLSVKRQQIPFFTEICLSGFNFQIKCKTSFKYVQSAHMLSSLPTKWEIFIHRVTEILRLMKSFPPLKQIRIRCQLDASFTSETAEYLRGVSEKCSSLVADGSINILLMTKGLLFRYRSSAGKLLGTQDLPISWTEISHDWKAMKFERCQMRR